MRFITLIALLITLGSCRQSSQPTLQPDSLGGIIAAHTSGTISNQDDVQIRLNTPVDANLVGQELSSKILFFSPSIKGKAHWQNEYTIVFKPEDKWQSGQEYTANVDLSSLIEIEPKKDVYFTFNVRPIKLKFKIDPPSYNRAVTKASGLITSTDPVDDQAIEEMLAIDQEGNGNLAIEWKHYSPTSHGFVISNIHRSDKKSFVKIAWDGSAIDPKFEGKKAFSVLPKGAFEIVSATVNNQNRTVQIVFSNALNERQNLKGLVSLNKKTKNIKTDITDNILTVYPNKKINGQFELVIDKSIESYDNRKLGKPSIVKLTMDPSRPALRLEGKGVVVPNSKSVIFPFKAQNLKGAIVEVFKIHEDNVLQFLQTNRLDNNYQLNYVGNIVHREKINLEELNTEDNSTQYVRYALDLSKLINLDPGSIYEVRVGFGMNDVKEYPCKKKEVAFDLLEYQSDDQKTIMRNEYGRDYNWQQRDDPCSNSYYTRQKFISRNVLASNIGIIAKIGKDQSFNVMLTDLKDVTPLTNTTFSFYNFQQQLIQSFTTNKKGMVSDKLSQKPSFIIVNHKGTFGYLSLKDQDANSLSEFEVDGKKEIIGIDGFIYGERGVWRPGDTIHLSYIMEDKLNTLPDDHPVRIEVKGPRGKVRYNHTTSQHIGRIYRFDIPTEASAPTGSWRAVVSVGKNNFSKMLKVETVKPNRIKIDVEKESIILSQNATIPINAQWLHGSPASNLKATVDLALKPIKTTFEGYREHNFDDPARKIDAYPARIFDGKLSESGSKDIIYKKNKSWQPPGLVKAVLTTKVFEQSGNQNTDTYTMNAYPYDSYVGIRVPTNRWGSKYINSVKPASIPIVVVDKDGKPIANRKVTVGLYEAKWNWWYDRGYSDRYRYYSSDHVGSVTKETVTTNANGVASYTPKEALNYYNYMIRVCDESTGHCTGDFFYTNRYYNDIGSSESRAGATQLVFETDKTSYKTGEDITVKIPSTASSKILMSIENGQNVLQSFWIDGKKDITEISIPTSSDMNSNIYLHAHLVQPHNDGKNDLPIRMYGVVPIEVIDRNSLLNPEIKAPKQVEPNSAYTVDISEQNGKEMYYTLAVVDEGLLSLTRYKTPKPWKHFYSKKSLGVKTWDIYDYVLDGYGGSVDQFISIGGDEGSIDLDNAREVNRFKPVVKYIGPFKLDRKSKNTHKLKMENYVGAVRVMVVSRGDKKYGSAESSIIVKKPLMVQATLPRVLAPGESVDLSANVWAMEDKIRDVNVTISTTENIGVTNGNSQQLNFSKIGDKQANFKLQVGDEAGVAKINSKVKGSGSIANDEINIKIRNPNPVTTNTIAHTLKAGESWSTPVEYFGLKNTNTITFEVSSIPPVNLERRMKYLIRYPYGCLEQTTSSVFPQLYLPDFVELDDKATQLTIKNVTAAIRKLENFLLADGSFAYWAGTVDRSSWGTSYAGHFLLEAKAKGFSVPSRLIDAFVAYQNSNAHKQDNGYLDQAYRLFTLALAGSPNIGAMNRMRKQLLPKEAAPLLAAAYALIKQDKAANQLLKSNLNSTIKDTGYTYGSSLRNLSLLALTYHYLNDEDSALKTIQDISRALNNNSWHSTQTTAMAMLAISKIYQADPKEKLAFDFALNGNKSSIISDKSMYIKRVDLGAKSSGTLAFTNKSVSPQFIKVNVSGQAPLSEAKPAYNKHLALSVKYVDLNGKTIDHLKIEQGKDFTAIVTVNNLGTRYGQIDEIALSQIFPSGWEIQNDRVNSNTQLDKRVEYQDIRDDRVLSFFDLQNKKSITIKTKLTAAYSGRFYMPPVLVEAMYDHEITANTDGRWVEVIRD